MRGALISARPWTEHVTFQYGQLCAQRARGQPERREQKMRVRGAALRPMGAATGRSKSMYSTRPERKSWYWRQEVTGRQTSGLAHYEQ